MDVNEIKSVNEAARLVCELIIKYNLHIVDGPEGVDAYWPEHSTRVMPGSVSVLRGGDD